MNAFISPAVKQLQVDATFRRIPPGNLGEFKALAAQALEIARSEPGTLQYAWFFDEDETVCVVREV